MYHYLVYFMKKLTLFFSIALISLLLMTCCSDSSSSNSTDPVNQCSNSIITNKWWISQNPYCTNQYFGSDGVYRNQFTSGTWTCVPNDTIKVNILNTGGKLVIVSVNDSVLVAKPDQLNYISVTFKKGN